jgi:hypothetical protein
LIRRRGKGREEMGRQRRRERKWKKQRGGRTGGRRRRRKEGFRKERGRK